MSFLYDLGIRAYRLGVGIASISNPKAKAWIEGRRDVFTKLREALDGKEHVVWFHCASLGEYEQGKPVMELLKEKDPSIFLLVTFFSPSGYEIRKDDPLIDHVCYMPLDTRSNATRFVGIARPKLAVFVKYEFWLNHINRLLTHRIPTYFISAIFRPDQHLFSWKGKQQLEALKKVDHIFLQEERSLHILKEHGFANCSIAGDTRFDRVFKTYRETESLDVIESFKGDSRLLIAGSSWPAEESILIPYINSGVVMKFIIAPHDIHEDHITAIMDQLTVPAIRYSEMNDASDHQVLVIDNIGLLARAYKYGDIAFIGGGFSGSLHNILEAATFGMPVLFGPKHDKFPEAAALVDQGGAFVVSNAEEWNKRMEFLLEDPMVLQLAGEMSRNFVLTNKGATETIVKALTSHLNQS